MYEYSYVEKIKSEATSSLELAAESFEYVSEQEQRPGATPPAAFCRVILVYVTRIHVHTAVQQHSTHILSTII